jgi:hypothetical protein
MQAKLCEGPGVNDLGEAGLLTLSDAAVAKAGNVMAVTRLDGSAALGATHPLGIYRDDSRFLSGYELTLDGERPVLLATVEDGPAATRFELTRRSATRCRSRRCGSGCTGRSTRPARCASACSCTRTRARRCA